MNVLFVCAANKDRSKTAAAIFSIDYPQHNFDSAGTNRAYCNRLNTVYIQKEQLDWADLICVMEDKHAKIIQDEFGDVYLKKINVLQVADVYTYGGQSLKEKLAERVKPILDEQTIKR